VSPAARHWRLGLVLVATLLAFRNVTGLPFTIVDDPSFVVHNPFVIDPFGQGLVALLRTTSMGYPHTVTVLALALDRTLFGTDPAGYHAVSLAVHLLNVVLIYLLVLRFDVSLRAAAAAAALFALHPIVVEPVCWVIGRKDLLSTTLLLAGLLVLAGRRRDAGRRVGVLRWIAGDLLCIAAMLAKPSALTAPGLVWVVLRCLRPAESFRHMACGVAPQLLAGVLIVRTGVSGLHEQGAVVERSPLGIVWDILRAWTLQVQHVLWPRGLVVEYERTAEGVPSSWLVVAVTAATSALLTWLWWRFPRRSVARMVPLFIGLAYLPVAGLLPTQHWTADSYFYLPLVGVAVGFATVVARWWTDLSGFAFVALAFAIVSFVQVRTWTGAVAMFAPVAAAYPDDPRPLNRLAYSYAHQGDALAAARAYVELEETFPEHPYNRGERAWAYAFLGDRAKGDAVLRRCAEIGDTECTGRLFVDVVTRRRDARSVSPQLLAATYEVAAAQLPRRLDSDGLRMVARWLRDAGLDELAARADGDAEAAARRASAASAGSVAP
jgi:protein O-mannosyl-transferase